MTRLRLKIEGRPKQMSMDSFSDVIKQSGQILRELDRAVTREKRGTLEWVVSELGMSSLYIETQSTVVRGDEDFAEQVASKFVEGVSKIRRDVATPPLFSVDSVNGLLKIVRILKRGGDQCLNISLPDLEKKAMLTADSEPNLIALRGVSRKVLGAVEGRIELVSIHRPYRRFNVYHSISNKAVKCTLPEELERRVIDSLGKRVSVTGTVAYNTLGEPLSVEVRKIRVLKERASLPSIEDVLGLAPDFTDDLSTEEYLRSIRVG